MPARKNEMLSVPLTVTISQEDGTNNSSSGDEGAGSSLDEYDVGVNDDDKKAPTNGTSNDGTPLGEGVWEMDLDSYRIKPGVPIASPVVQHDSSYSRFDGGTATFTKGRGDSSNMDDDDAEAATAASPSGPTPSSMRDTFQFVFGCGRAVTLLFVIGVVGAAVNGLVYPAIAYVLSHTFSNMSSAGANGLSTMNQIAYSFLAVGGVALVAGLAQNWAFELVAYHASQNYRKQVRVCMKRVIAKFSFDPDVALYLRYRFRVSPVASRSVRAGAAAAGPRLL
jgi:ABC transporter transmembrane region